jgi:predicted GH43/DUF377 family glycosyl hydrolase
MTALRVERLNNGKPLIAPSDRWWETGVTFNSAALYLERSERNDPLIRGMLEVDDLDAAGIAEGVVALHYRGRPKESQGFRLTLSYVGLAVFTPGLQLLRRLENPVVMPGDNPADCDNGGVEDPRITRLGDVFYMVYCGLTEHPKWFHGVCMARSTDLIHWDKLGLVPGDVNCMHNKDGVLLPDRLYGKYWLLHRPMTGELWEHPMQIACADSPEGVWTNCGTVCLSYPNPAFPGGSKIGAGSVPIPLGNMRYLHIYHLGNYYVNGDQETSGPRMMYNLHAMILNFNGFDPCDPSMLVEKRLEPLMKPETDYEIASPFPGSVGNVLFTCGSYEKDGYVYIIYGGGDSYILAARVRKDALIEAIENAPSGNPHL